jgi:hypothetical protein
MSPTQTASVTFFVSRRRRTQYVAAHKKIKYYIVMFGDEGVVEQAFLKLKKP